MRAIWVDRCVEVEIEGPLQWPCSPMTAEAGAVSGTTPHRGARLGRA